MSRTDQQIYMAIANIVTNVVPAGWQKIIVSAAIADDNGETLYDYLDDSGTIGWFAPESSSQYEVYTAFQELRSSMKTANYSWDKARFTLESSGKFRIEFDY